MFLHNSTLKKVNTKIEVLNNESTNRHDYSPIEHIKSGLKPVGSIAMKLKKDGCEVTIENMIERLSDIVGIGIVCSFTPDIYQIAGMVATQRNVTVFHAKGYIKDPKPNGYKSYHMVVTVSVYLTDGPVETKAGTQTRSVAVDFWASLEHEIAYKFEGNAPGDLLRGLKVCTDMVDILDTKMFSLNEVITVFTREQKERSEESQMDRLIRGADQVIELSLRQLVIFEVLFWLIASTFYIRLVNQLLGFSLRMIGYSYPTVSNIRASFLCPATIAYASLAAVLGMVLMMMEIGGLIAAYQTAAYLIRVDSVCILKGALGRTWDACKKRNWELLPLALADYAMINSYLLLRILTRIKPLSSVMYEIIHTSAIRPGPVMPTAALIPIGIPTMLVFFACMTEQRQSRDGFRRSMEFLKGCSLRAVVPLLVVNFGLAVGLVLMYAVIVVISAVIVTLFVDSYAAMIVLATVCTKLEAVVLLIGGILTPLMSSGALTVIYYQYGMKGVYATPWDFTMPYKLYFKRKRILTITGALAGVSLPSISDVVYNDISSDWDVLGQTEVTACGGGPRMAPGNIMTAIEVAMEEMADYSEIDVQTTADRIVAVCHDLNLKRVVGVDRRLGTMTCDQVSRLDVGSHFSLRFVKKRIPTLGEVLGACKGRMGLSTRLKNIENSSSLPEQVATLIREYGMEGQCVITSAKLGYLGRVEEMTPELRTGYILAAAYGAHYDNEYTDFINTRSSFVGRKLVEAVHEKGRAIHMWAVNSKTEIEQMKLLGVDNIITDYPAWAGEILYRERTTGTLMEYLKVMLR